MAEAIEVQCDQADCPIAAEGRCLEGFPAGKGCPHLEIGQLEGDDQVPVEPQESASDSSDPVDEPLLSLSGGEALSAAEAHEIAFEFGATVVLVAGEFESGKTTLLVELYGMFLRSPADGWLFGGSQTLVALDKRHLGTRHASGKSRPSTDRTQPEHEGLMHLRLVRDSRTVALFLTDLRGERFEHVVDGVPVLKEVPFVLRADRILVLVDGDKIADPAKRQDAVHRTRQLIGGLTESEGLKPNRPMAIVLTKLDLLSAADISWFENQVQALLSFAVTRGAVPTYIAVAARPDIQPDESQGLRLLLDWLTQEQMAPSTPNLDPAQSLSDRHYWRLNVP